MDGDGLPWSRMEGARSFGHFLFLLGAWGGGGRGGGKLTKVRLISYITYIPPGDFLSLSPPSL